MADNDTNSESFIPDLFKIEHEYVFKLIGRYGKYSLETKCILLVCVLLIPALVATFFAGTLPDLRLNFPGTLLSYFIAGWGHLFATLFLGFFMWVLVRYFRNINKRIQQIDEIISPSTILIDRKPSQHSGSDQTNSEWKLWKSRREKFKDWCQRKSMSLSWFYFSSIGGAVIGLLLAMYLIGPEHGWTQGFILPELYLITWYVSYGFLVGASLQYISVGFWVIRKFCKTVVTRELVRPLDPDSTGGLKQLGRLSLDLDLIVAIPSIAFPIAVLLFKQSELFGYQIRNTEVGWMLAALYALLLVTIFFISISPAHDAMVEAKNEYLLRIHNEYKDMHEELIRKLKPKELIEPEEYERLLNLYKLYDRVEQMAVWPLDFRTVVRFAITSLLPLLSVGITLTLGV